jgi:hypothetical protein
VLQALLLQAAQWVEAAQPPAARLLEPQAFPPAEAQLLVVTLLQARLALQEPDLRAWQEASPVSPPEGQPSVWR